MPTNNRRCNLVEFYSVSTGLETIEKIYLLDVEINRNDFCLKKPNVRHYDDRL
jgi:hypothetical protein